MPSSKGSSQPRDQTHMSFSSCFAGRFSTPEPPCGKGLLAVFLLAEIGKIPGVRLRVWG